MKKFSFFVLLFISYSYVFSQTSIQGKVVDENNQPLCLANVILENTYIGTFTNANGEFLLKNIKSGKYQLKVSFVGYQTHVENIEVKNEPLNLTIQLKKATYIADEVIVQATRANSNLVSTTAISKEQLSRNEMIQDVPYLISMTPSVVTTSDAGTGIGYTGLSIRGSDVRRINVTINDIPINDAESHGVWWVDLPDIASSTENIHIQRGVGTSTNGAGAFGASINLQTIGLSKEPSALIQASYGSFNTSKFMINSSTGLLNNHYTVDLRLSKIYSDGFVDRAFSDLKSYYFAAGYYSSKNMIKFINFAGYEKTYQAWYGIPKDSLKTNPTYNPYTYKNQTDNYWQSHYQLHITNEISSKVHLHTALHYTKGKGYYESYRKNKRYSYYGLPNVSDSITRSDFIDQKWLDNDFYGIISSLKYNLKRINTTLGISFNRYEGLHYGDVIWGQYLPYNIPGYRWYYGTGDKKDFNTFLKTDFLINEKLLAFGDLQLRTIDYVITGTDDDLRDVSQKHNYQFFNPKAGFQLNVNNEQQIQGLAAVAHREPTRSDFTDADSGKTPKPERLIDLELMYQYKTKKLYAGINFYYMYYINQLVMTGEINNVGTPINTNVPESYRRGIELMFGIKPYTNISWQSNLTVSQNKIVSFTAFFDDWDTWSQVAKDYSNSDISFSPNLIANTSLMYEFQKNSAIQLMYQYVSEQYLSNIKNDEAKIPAYSTVNLVVNYSLYPKWCKEVQFQLSGRNLLGKIYASNGWAYSYYSGGQLMHEIGLYPQAKNILMGSIIFKL